MRPGLRRFLRMVSTPRRYGCLMSEACFFVIRIHDYELRRSRAFNAGPFKKHMRIERLYIRSFLASVLLACAGVLSLFAFVYSTGIAGLGLICAAVLLLFAFLYGWFRPLGLVRRRAGLTAPGEREAASHLTVEENAKRLKV